MPEQRWFAGVPAVGERRLAPEDHDRLVELVSAVRRESLWSYLTVGFGAVSVIAALWINVPTNWVGFVIFGLASAAIRLLPQRRFYSLQTFLGLRRDLAAQTVQVCEMEDMILEVLSHSHLIWTRNGVPVDSPVIAHATVTTRPPEHAALAANFVRSMDDGSALLFHQRTLTDEELQELDSYAPQPELVLLVLAIVGVAGGVLTAGLFLLSRLTAFWPALLFLLIGSVASVKMYLAYKAHKLIASDLELGFVVIVRSQEQEELSPPQEFLPFSGIVWTEAGSISKWRTQLRTKT